MSFQTDDKWFGKHNRLVENGRDIMILIQELACCQEKNGSTSKVSSKIRLNLQNYSNEITNLRNETLFAISNKTISTTDQLNRNAMLDSLSTRLKSLECAFKTNLNSVYEKADQRLGVYDNQRSLLLTTGGQSKDNSARFNSSTVEWNESASGQQGKTPFFCLEEEEDLDDHHTFPDDRQLLIHKAKQSQEKNLDVLADLISKQKHAALHISNEVSNQNEIIDDISIHIDRTKQKLIRGAQDIRVVTKKSKSWPYWLIIIFLLILIITVLFI